jgi:hypothetical protein
MKKYAGYAGTFGLIFFIFGAVASIAFQNELQSIGFAQLAVGFFGILYFAYFYFRDALTVIIRKKESIYGALGGLLVLFVLVGINVIAQSKFGEKKWDLTETKVHSLSAATKEVLSKLKGKVEIISFMTDPRSSKIIKEMMGKYSYESSKVSFSSKDPDKEPELVTQYEIKGQGIVVVNKSIGNFVNLNSFSEEDVTTAIKRVMLSKKTKIYFLQGHGEPSLADDDRKGLFYATFLLKREGYEVESLNLGSVSEVPGDANIVAAWGASKPISVKEATLLENFVSRGGKLIIAQDPLLNPKRDGFIKTGFENILKKYGLRFHPSIVLEQPFPGMVMANLPLSDFEDHSITNKLKSQNVNFSLSQAVLQTAPFKNEAERVALVKTSAQSWAETDAAAFFIKKKVLQKGKLQGPLALAQIVEWKLKEDSNNFSNEGQLVVFGDADFALGSLIPQGLNQSLVLSTFSYLAGEEEISAIRPRKMTASVLKLNKSQKRFVYYSSIFAIPEIILCFGLGIWLARRRRT